MAESIGLIERAAALLRQREAVEGGSAAPAPFAAKSGPPSSTPPNRNG